MQQEKYAMLLIRFSEIAIKSPKTRKWLTTKLIKHIRYILDTFYGKPFSIIRKFSRIYVEGEEIEKIEELITKYVPGVISTSKVVQCLTIEKDIQENIKKHLFKNIKKNSSFAVKVKRTGKHSFTSIELAKRMGDYIFEQNSEKNIYVNLDEPDYRIYLEVRDEKTYIFDDVVKGLGGLPEGCQGKVLTVVTGEKEDLSNIVQMFKRGANTIILALGNIDELEEKFRKQISLLLKIQPTTRKKYNFKGIKGENKIEQILETYKKSKAKGIVLSNNIFQKFEESIPVSIPIFVPHLVTEINEKEIEYLLS